MTISGVGSAGAYAPLVRPQPTAVAPKATVAAVGGDADGDNDGSKGSAVDVRA